ncbi:MAG TPA: enoyl-CoA hydratase/isomerase family protein [Acetobacteraceae bacterium]|nr:enoyl-CoA hydratase/isomerase family protein [Acetobacteraceae bacterium]
MSAATAKAGAESEARVPTLTVDGARATIRLNRPRHMNRIQPEDIDALVRLFDEVDAESALRVLVLTGTGRAFSAGYHLGDLHERAEGAGRGGGVPSFEGMVNRLEALRVPTICRLQGGVYGGSTDLALSCDFRIGHAGVEMFMPAGRLGVHYYEAGMRRYVSRLGLNAAKRLFLTAERIDAAEMLRIGYLTHLVPDEAGLDPAIDALAGRIAGLAPLAVQGMKRALNEIAHGALDVPALEARQVRCSESEDLKEGLAAFWAKREPAFRGR